MAAPSDSMANAGPERDTRERAMADDATGRPVDERALRALNADLERRLAERTAELNEARRELEAFASSVSHDLRAPLRAIEGFTDLLITEHGARLEGTAGNMMLRVRGAAMRMGQLIDGLLALSRTTRARLHREHVDLTGIARDVAAELRAQAPDREVSFEIEPGVFAEGDTLLLRQLLENLLGNAWKYTSANRNGHVAFGIVPAVAGQPRRYFVRDDGAGFDMAYASKLFKPFERLHTEREFPGVGIGLATVFRIVSRHGGTLTAEGVPGKGATFTFTLGADDPPVARSSAPTTR